MAINTGGYDLSQFTKLPTTPLVQADPDAVNNGILSQFKVATESDKLQALKMLLEENQDLHDDRQAQAHANLQNLTQQAQAAMTLRPGATANTLYDQGTTALAQPIQRDTTLSNLNFTNSQLPVVQNTASIANSMANTAAQNDQATQPDALAVDANKKYIAARTSDASVDNIDQSIELAKTKLATEVQAAQDAYDNGPQDADAKRDLLAAQIRASRAQSDLEEGRAGYYNARAGGQNANVLKPGDIIKQQAADLKEVSANQTEIGKLRNEGVALDENGKAIPVWQYNILAKQDTDAGGKDYLPGGPKYAPQAAGINDQITFHEAQIQAIRDPKDPRKAGYVSPVTVGVPNIRGSTVGSPLVQTQAPAATDSDPGAKEVDVSSLTPDQQQAYSWALENQDDPRAPAIWASLPSK